MIDRCPSDLALEQHLLDPERSPIRHHAEGCGRCTARLEEMRRQGEDFRREVFPVTVEAVEAAAGTARAPGWWRWLLLGPAGVAAAAVLVLLMRPAVTSDPLAGSGDGLGMAVDAGEAAAARPLRDGATVMAAAALRVRVRVAAPCRLWILSLDASGQVSRRYPGDGTGGAPVSGTVELPERLVLDGQSGPERLYAICTPGPSRWRALAERLKVEGATGAAAVRVAPSAAELPPGTQLASLLVEKRS